MLPLGFDGFELYGAGAAGRAHMVSQGYTVLGTPEVLASANARGGARMLRLTWGSDSWAAPLPAGALGVSQHVSMYGGSGGVSYFELWASGALWAQVRWVRSAVGVTVSVYRGAAPAQPVWVADAGGVNVGDWQWVSVGWTAAGRFRLWLGKVLLADVELPASTPDAVRWHSLGIDLDNVVVWDDDAGPFPECFAAAVELAGDASVAAWEPSEVVGPGEVHTLLSGVPLPWGSEGGVSTDEPAELVLSVGDLPADAVSVHGVRVACLLGRDGDLNTARPLWGLASGDLTEGAWLPVGGAGEYVALGGLACAFGADDAAGWSPSALGGARVGWEVA